MAGTRSKNLKSQKIRLIFSRSTEPSADQKTDHKCPWKNNKRSDEKRERPPRFEKQPTARIEKNEPEPSAEPLLESTLPLI